MLIFFNLISPHHRRPPQNLMVPAESEGILAPKIKKTKLLIFIYTNNHKEQTMGITRSKKTVKAKKKVLTKKEKAAKRVLRMQKVIEYRKRVKRARKGKVVPIKKRREQEADEEIIDYASKKDFDNTTQNELNILSVLGLGNENGQCLDWEMEL